MDVWMKIANKKANCAHCHKPIVKGDYMVIGKLWRRRDGVARSWTTYLRWHVQCWVDQAKAAVDRIPRVETRGRRKSPLDKESRDARVKILRRRAAVLQRIRNEISKPSEAQSFDRLIHLGELLNRLKSEIVPLGGVPKSWN